MFGAVYDLDNTSGGTRNHADTLVINGTHFFAIIVLMGIPDQHDGE
jgi:hypothetical protein